MPEVAQPDFDHRMEAQASPEEPGTRSAFDVTDDLREPIDDITRLKDAEAKTREIIQKYQAAMREMEVRFEILDQDLNLKKHRNPIHHVESRIKKPASIFEKLGRYGKEATLENMEDVYKRQPSSFVRAAMRRYTSASVTSFCWKARICASTAGDRFFPRASVSAAMRKLLVVGRF